MINKMKVFLISDFLGSLRILITTAPAEFTMINFLSTMLAGFKLSVLVITISIFGGLGEWVIENAVYVNLVIGAIFIDWILGTIKHWLWLKDFHWKENIKGILVKLLLTLTVGFVVEGLRQLSIEYNVVARHILQILRLTVFMYPATSIIRSARVISNGSFPPQKIYDTIENWTDGIGNKKTKDA